jgi:hypothetical protein
MKIPSECTLFELLRHVNEVTESEYEALVMVTRLLNSGQVRLCGTFAGAKIGLPDSLAPFPKAVWPVLLSL